MSTNEFEWDFKEESSKSTFTVLPEGDYRVRIESAEKAVSQTGNMMLKLKLKINGGSSIFHHIVFLKDKPEITNRNLTSFFNSFAVELGNFTLSTYAGKVGAAHIVVDEYKGEQNNKVKFFLDRKKQETLPAWSENGSASPEASGMFAMESDLPF